MNMAVELGKSTESYNMRSDRSVAEDILNPSQLVEKEHEALREFFGKDVPVVVAPSELIETQKVAEAEGFGRILEPIYFPAVKFKQTNRYSGWMVGHKDRFDQITVKKVRGGAVKLGGYWGLFDKSRRPDYDHYRRQMFTEDPLASILSKARREGRIGGPFSPGNVSPWKVPEGSRFAVSLHEQDQTVFPELATILRLTEGAASVRLPTVMEFNFAGNLRYSHLGGATTWEWLYDNSGVNRRLVGGNSNYERRFTNEVRYYWFDFQGGLVAFRPLVVFHSKLG